MLEPWAAARGKLRLSHTSVFIFHPKYELVDTIINFKGPNHYCPMSFKMNQPQIYTESSFYVCSYAEVLYVVSAHSLDMTSKQFLFGGPCIERRERKNCLRACNMGVSKIHSNIIGLQLQ